MASGAATGTDAEAVTALFAPDPPVADHPAIGAASRLAHDVLAPHAAAADDPARGVDPVHLALLADAGLFSVAVPRDEGGLGGDVRVDAEVIELLSGACGATWFVHTQHQLPQAAARGTFGTPGPADAGTARRSGPGRRGRASRSPTCAARVCRRCGRYPTARAGGSPAPPTGAPAGL